MNDFCSALRLCHSVCTVCALYEYMCMCVRLFVRVWVYVIYKVGTSLIKI